MPLFSFEGVRPRVHPGAWIAPTATLIGDVVVEKDVSIWYGAVIPKIATSAWVLFFHTMSLMGTGQPVCILTATASGTAPTTPADPTTSTKRWTRTATLGRMASLTTARTRGA